MTTNPATQQHTPDPRIPSRLLCAWLVVLLVLRGGAALSGFEIAGMLLNLQDRWLVLVQLALAGLATLWAGMVTWRCDAPPWRLTGRQTALIAMAVVALCWAGHYAVLCGYDLSRDEQMASFDAAIYAAHHLAWPLPAMWRNDADALNLLFMPPVTHPVAWVSGYLPGNALLRAGVGAMGDTALTGPLLTGIAVLATWGAGMRLWGDTAAGRDATAVAVLLLATSGMALFMGMTAYAMPAHLAANAVWLWLFLAGRWRADMLAVALGFVATGLHQPLFHPLFVAPWLALLLADRRWARLSFYTLAYAAIGLFWLAWPHMTIALVSGPHSTPEPGGGFVSRLFMVLADNHHNLPLMAANLLRFATWQAVPMLPLLIYGLWRAAMAPVIDRRALALAAGFAAPIVIMAVILPYQGHGFGYRYLHQALGNAALLAGHGWRGLAPWHARARPLLARGLLLSVAVLLPVQGWMAHGIYAPFARASARLDASGADYAIIALDDAPLALDLVRNRPDLSNRPIRLSATEIDDPDEMARRLCHARPAVTAPAITAPVTIAMPDDSFYDDIDAVFQMPRQGRAARRIAEDGPSYTDAGCRITVPR